MWIMRSNSSYFEVIRQIRGLVRERMAIISLYSQMANDNCFENVPYVLILESKIIEMIHCNRTVYVKEKLNYYYFGRIYYLVMMLYLKY